ncbi:hypothetical protein SeLEV6574_g00171 [Synchytrium endobioticum]|nr:hypothetical protein SeLEV6574_g00171 [Synchytrium endobioticum]
MTKESVGSRLALVPIPGIYVQCHCRVIQNQSPISTESSTIQEHTQPESILPPPYADTFTLHPLASLYWCDSCKQIKCCKCTLEEVVCYYCPNCLFEVPSASVKADKHMCARNCFSCPVCTTTVSVVTSIEVPPLDQPSRGSATTQTPSASAPTSSPAAPQSYHLTCPTCHWDSRQVGVQFEKPTGLAMQLQKHEDERPDIKNFDALKEHFENVVRLSAAFEQYGIGATRQSRSTGTRTPSKHSWTSSLLPMSRRMEVYGAAESIHPFACPTVAVNQPAESVAYDQVSTLRQRLLQPEHQPLQVSHLRPRRIHLRTKLTRRCRTCEHILIKPEQKAQVTKLKVKLTATDFLPAVTIAPPFPAPPFTSGQPIRFVIRFTNPLTQEMSVSLATPSTVSASCNVTIIAPNFTIPPFNELWEYDDPSPSSYSASRASQQLNSATGIYERRRNYTCIMIQVVPHTGRVEFPLMVVVTRNIAQPATGDLEASRTAAASSAGITATRLTTSYWVWVGLGVVEE